MKAKSVLLFLLVLLSAVCSAQKLEGVITYEQVTRDTKRYARLTFLTNEQRERMKMTWGSRDEWKTNTEIFFNENQSYYTYSEQEEGVQRWGRQRDYRIYRNFATGKKTDIIEMFGKTYIVEDSIRTPNWKVMNKIREIGGYMCMMAVAEDTIKKQKITAWFANNFPVSFGPELYSGLPGAILELDVNDGDVVITAKKIELKPLTKDISVPKKIKGKVITNKQYDELVAKFLHDSEKAQMAYFWEMPY